MTSQKHPTQFRENVQCPIESTDRRAALFKSYKIIIIISALEISICIFALKCERIPPKRNGNRTNRVLYIASSCSHIIIECKYTHAKHKHHVKVVMHRNSSLPNENCNHFYPISRCHTDPPDAVVQFHFHAVKSNFNACVWKFIRFAETACNIGPKLN